MAFFVPSLKLCYTMYLKNQKYDGTVPFFVPSTENQKVNCTPNVIIPMSTNVYIIHVIVVVPTADSQPCHEAQSIQLVSLNQ